MRTQRLWCLAGLFALAVAQPATAQIEVFAENFESRSGGNGTVLFRQPSFSGSTSGLLMASPNVAQVLTERALSGSRAVKVSWQWRDGTAFTWLRLTTFNVMALGNPAIPVTNGYVELQVYNAGPADLYVSLGVRETNTTVALGTNSGTAGSIEWVGATSVTVSGASGIEPKGKLVPAGRWTTLGFEMEIEPVQFFTGNSILETLSGRATLESLGITPVDVTQRGPYTIYIDDLFMATNVRDFGGGVISDCVTPPPVFLEFRSVNPADPVFTRAALTNENGIFMVKVPAGTYHVGIRSRNSLRKVIPNVTVDGSLLLPPVTLVGGDANADNVVDVLDLDILIGAFDAVEGDAGYTGRADFNCDGAVDVLDLDIFIRNFDQAGDEFP